MAPKAKLGLALGSGGARGLAHLGVLAVLEAAGIRPDVISGTSMGAIVGGLYAEEPEAEVAWQRMQTYLDDSDFTASWSAFVSRESGNSENGDHTSRWQDLMDFVQRKVFAIKTVTRPYLQDAERLRKPLENLFRVKTFAELEIPFAAVALDLITGRRVMFEQGDLVEGIYASSSIPAIFPPLYQEGMVIIDGGGPFRVPVQACRDLGADLVVAVDIPAFQETKYGTGLDIILRSNTIARQRLNNFVLSTADLIIRPEVEEFHWADFRAGDACRAKGVEAAEEMLPALKELLRYRGSFKYRLSRQLYRLAHRFGLTVELVGQEID
jgi:NTE family protein